MTSAVMMERFSATSATSMPSHHAMNLPAAAPMAGNWCVVPRCKIEFEKCAGGFKMHCKCDDDMSCATLHNLCKMLSDGLCSCVCMMNGIECCKCSMANCHCKVEYTEDGCTITCTSGDKQCCEMLQACCDCCEKCCENGCCCYVCFGGTPVCCATC